MKNYLKMTREGFTLVELMIVVAIIGVLASIAVPQYSKFQAKSRQSEVRIQLGGAYTVEQSFAAENSTYTGCLGQVGYNRDGTKFYYTIGFAPGLSAAAGCMPGSVAAGACNVYQWVYCDGVNTNNGCAAGAPTYIASATGVCASNTASNDMFPANISEPNSPAGTVSAAGAPSVQGDVPAAPAASLSSNNFILGAAGKVLSKATLVDQWTIDQSKQMINNKSGLQ
jgi:type IV pilus assembly protein PilA